MEAIKLRKLAGEDIFAMSRVIGKIGIKNFKKCFASDELKAAISNLSSEEKKNDEGIASIGILAAFDVADVLFEHLPDCENELYQFLANLAGLKPQEIKKLPPATLLELIVEVVKAPEFMDFLKVALRLFK